MRRESLKGTLPQAAARLGGTVCSSFFSSEMAQTLPAHALMTSAGGVCQMKVNVHADKVGRAFSYTVPALTLTASKPPVEVVVVPEDRAYHVVFLPSVKLGNLAPLTTTTMASIYLLAAL